MKGSIVNQTTVGEIAKNTAWGIFGTISDTARLNINQKDVLEVATRDEIAIGKAVILCTLENNIKKEYEIEIQKLYKNNNTDNKSMMLKVTDQELLETTGGIIQGMSGSPIIQNGKFVRSGNSCFSK